MSAAVAYQSTAAEIDLTWSHLKYTVTVKDDDGKPAPKVLLKDVSGTARRCRTLAVMGPSGAGKSTFLNGISGRLAINKEQTLEGTAFLNDVLFLTKYKQLMSYVAQDDIVMGKDTPREALAFSYRIRSGATAEETEVRVAETLKKLSLEKCADTLLGIPGLLKGVSGGEKKRTNIGSELINNPLILLLDEPTTGLDSVNALRVGQLLQDLAHNDHRTVICTIHTPSSELFDTFDDLLLFSQGNVIYHGTREGAIPYFAQVGYPVPHRENPSEHYMTVLQNGPEEINELAAKWKAFVSSEEGRKNQSVNRTPTHVRTAGDDHYDKLVKESTISATTELMLLTERSWRTTMRDPAGTIGKFVQAIFFAVLLALFFANLGHDDDGVQDRNGVLFMETINLTFLHVMTALTVFPPERAVFLVEQTNGSYSAWLYYLSKVIAEIPLQIVIPTIYTIITYWSWGLASGAVAYFNHLAIVLVLSYTANAFGMFIAALFPRAEIAITFAPLLLMPQIIVAGLFANTDRLEPYWVWLEYLAFPRYIFKAFTVNEYDHASAFCDGQSPDNSTCRYYTGKQALDVLGFTKTTDTVWFSIIIVLVIMVVFRFIGAFALHIQGTWTRAHLVFEGNYRKNGASLDAIDMQPVA